jgi:hypothetical protein
MIQRSTGILSDEDVSLLQGLKKKDHVVCYTIAIPFALITLLLFYRWLSGDKEGVGIGIFLFSGVTLFITFAGWHMQKQQRMLQAHIDAGEKHSITGMLLDVVVHGYDRLRYCFENNTSIEVYLPLDKLHKRRIQSIHAVKDSIVTLQITSGARPVLLHINYTGSPATTDLQPATDQDRRQYLKGQAGLAWITGGCLAIALLIIGIYSKWSIEAVISCFGLPAITTAFIVFLFYRYEKRLATKMTERLTISGRITEIIVARVGSGKHRFWHYFYRVGPYTFNIGGVSKATPGDDVQVTYVRMKNGKGQRIISVTPNNNDTGK